MGRKMSSASIFTKMAARDENQLPLFDFEFNFDDFSHDIDNEILRSIESEK